jgi:ABC-type dipeptide/oligopeptide/nickel transport system permease subunit
MTTSSAAPSLILRSRQVRGALWASLGVAVLAIAGLLVGAPASVACCVAGPSLAHPLGLDAGGRDLLQLVLRGLATSSLIVLASSVLAVVFGALYGAVVAALPRDLRTAGMRIVDVVAATPITLIVITLMVAVRAARAQLPSVLDPVLDSRFILVFCVASLQWLSLARVVYARLAFIAERPFVRAARIAGMSPVAVFLFHLVPHARGPLFVFGLLALPSGVVAEGFFSFLGFGVEAPEVSLGTLIAAGSRAMSVAPLTLFAPAVVLVTATIALQVLGARLRDELRPDESSGERQTR